jgi:hypothetical protein
MSLDADKILEEIKKVAEPQLRETAKKIKQEFLDAFQGHLNQSAVDKFDDMMETVADLQIKAVTAEDRNIASQYASAADAKMRQISILLVAEKIVASQEIGNLIEAAAITVWNGFKEVAVTLVGVVVKGAMSGLLGPVGGALADAAGDFLGGDQPTKA